MKRSMLVRVEMLESFAAASTPQFLRFGWLASQLPEDYEGERHYVPLNCRPTGSPFFEWCEFEEKAGPAPELKGRQNR